MTTEEMITALEVAVLMDDRWSITKLRNESREHVWKEACRHADNLIYATKTGSESVADASRDRLQYYIKAFRKMSALSSAG